MFCTHCGKNLNPNAVVCPGCGCAVPGAGNMAPHNSAQQPNSGDDGGFLWGFIGFITFLLTTPVLPIVLTIVWWNEYPKRARAILKGMIASIIGSVALTILIIAGYFIFIFLLLGMFV